MNNRMLKTRGRKRHIRSTRRKCINCTNWKERRTSKRSTHRKNRRQQKRSKQRSHKKRRMNGGRSDEPTVDTIDGFPVIKDADVSIPGYGSIPVEEFKKHEEYIDFQGSGGEPGYD